jgi:TolB-like protein
MFKSAWEMIAMGSTLSRDAGSAIDLARLPPASLPATTLGAGDAADTRPAADPETISERSYDEFVSALRDALRNFHRADLLARNPLLRLCGLDERAGPAELRALLTATASALFCSERDEKLRRVMELTYFKPAPKQEAVADRLSLPFGTYRRHLTTARDRLTAWLWQSPGSVPSETEPPLLRATANGLVTMSSGQGPLQRSVVVLPFLEIGGCAQGEAFVDGLTETLTTDLSRAAGIFVISRNTAFAYKGKAVDTRQIGRELGVRYTIEGSAQFTDGRARFNVHLVDAASGVQLWADRFDTQHTDFLGLQDEVVPRLTKGIEAELIAAEQRAH